MQFNVVVKKIFENYPALDKELAIKIGLKEDYDDLGLEIRKKIRSNLMIFSDERGKEKQEILTHRLDRTRKKRKRNLAFFSFVLHFLFFRLWILEGSLSDRWAENSLQN